MEVALEEQVEEEMVCPLLLEVLEIHLALLHLKAIMVVLVYNLQIMLEEEVEVQLLLVKMVVLEVLN